MHWNTVTLPHSKGGFGLRRARQTNVSLIGKHVWGLLHNPNKLWMQLLTRKYLKQRNSILHYTPTAGVSYTWCSIYHAADILKPGFVLRVGREDLSLWYDKWLKRGPICNLLPFVSIHDINLRLRDICHDGEWHFENIASHIPLDVQMEIRSIFLSQDVDDVVIWGPSNNGSYSSKSGYHWLTNQ